MENRIIIPDGMKKAVCQALWKKWGYADDVVLQKDVIDNEIFAVEAALGWLNEILHESNADFHKAILEAERIRCPGNDGASSVIARRVDFEYGVSFARNYIREIFLEPELPEAIKEAISKGVIKADPPMNRREYDIALSEAYRRGQRSSSESVESSVIEHFPRRNR